MMSMTHAIYAKKVREHILLKYNIRLKLTSLIYGSVKPDISTLFAKYPHYIDRSLIITNERFKILTDTIKSKRELETRIFARELGVGLHYIADYFCRVHNDINGYKHIENYKHIVYEQRLQNHAKNFDFDIMREEIFEKIDKNTNELKETSISKFILNENRNYMREASKMLAYKKVKDRYNLDIKYSYEMVLTMADYTIRSILGGENEGE